MEKRKVTLRIGGQPCSLYTDDSDEYISALEKRANDVLRRTAPFSGTSAYTNAILSVLSLADSLLRTERRGKADGKGQGQAQAPVQPRKNPVRPVPEEKGQISVWDLLEEGE